MNNKPYQVSEEADKIMRERIKLFQSVFSTPQGRQVIEVLKEGFCGDTLVEQSMEQTYRRSAEARVVYEIEKMARFTEEDMGTTGQTGH